MPAGKKEGGDAEIYKLGLGVFDDGSWASKMGAVLPLLGTTTVGDKGPTNTGNTAPKQNPDAHDREGAPDVDTPEDPGQDDMSDDW